jgi:ribonuclease J
MPKQFVTECNFQAFNNQESFIAGDFKITPYLVDHSAYDSYSFLIECGGEAVFYSGDFRGHGRKNNSYNNPAVALPDIDVLLLEGTSFGRQNDKPFLSEYDIEGHFASEMAQTTGAVLIQASAQNIDRIVTVYKASVRSGRKLVVDLYTASILEATGNRNIPQSHWDNVCLYIPEIQRRQIKQKKLFELLKKHSKNRIFCEDLSSAQNTYTILFRPVHMADMEKCLDLSESKFIYSMWEGYKGMNSYTDVRTWIVENDIDEKVLHTSGHADIFTMKELLDLLKPRKVIPIHTEYPDEYVSICNQVEIVENGEWRSL